MFIISVVSLGDAVSDLPRGVRGGVLREGFCIQIGSRKYTFAGQPGGSG